MLFKARILKYDTAEVVMESKPMSKHNAEKCQSGMDRNLNWHNYYTDMVAQAPETKGEGKR